MIRLCLLSLCALGLAGVALAQSVPAAPPPTAQAPAASPYTATVPVAGTSDAQRSTAIGAALAQVLQRVAPGFAAGTDALAQASGYVRNYRYQRAASGNGLQLQVDFDPGAIARLTSAKAVAAVTPATAGSAPAPAVAQGGSGTLWVSGIGNSNAFASLLAALRGQSALHDVVPMASAGDGVLLGLTSDQPLAAAVAPLEGPAGHLAPDPNPHPGADLSLRWVP